MYVPGSSRTTSCSLLLGSATGPGPSEPCMLAGITLCISELGWPIKNASLLLQMLLLVLSWRSMSGIATAHVAVQALGSLRTAIADVIGPSSGKRNVSLVFDCSTCSKDLDPSVHILIVELLLCGVLLLSILESLGWLGSSYADTLLTSRFSLLGCLCGALLMNRY